MIGDLVTALTSWLDRLPPPQPRMAALVTALHDEHGGRPDPVTEATLRRIEMTARRYCRHLELQLHPAGDLVVDETAPGWPYDDPAAVRRSGAPVSAVRRTEDGLTVLTIGSMPSYALTRPVVDAAITLTGGARGVALDLRGNGGGDPETVAALVGWLCGPGLELSSVVYRHRVRRWTTPDGPTLPASTPVVVLVGPGTYSSGEALAYHLQARRRGPVVGRTTPGAADHVTPVNLTPQVRAVLPEAYVLDGVTGDNWEGVGIRPDIETRPGDTESVALRILRHPAQ